MSAPITVIDNMDPAHFDSCARDDPGLGKKFEACVLGESKDWQIDISVSGGLPGTPGAEIFVPNALSVLQDIVDRCGLGSTFLQSGSDGQASLLVGHPDLTASQTACIRSAERAGLRLTKRAF
ncbi:MAG: hypothetical protein ABIT16_06165 [Croceibacterium sp.]